jgi:KDO2-lipid IV(A) lauroyltransferase
VSNQRGRLPAARTRLRREITLLGWHAWQRLDALLPRQVRFRLATIVGEALYWLLPRMRASTLANMRQVLGPAAPEAQVTLMAKRSFRNYAKYIAEFTHLPRWSDADLERLMTSVVGWEHVEDALSDGKGAIFITPHFGNWDVGGWYFGKRHPFSAVAEPLEPPELDALVQGWRQAKHMGIIPLAGAARGIMRALRGGAIVALVVDRPTHAQGEGVPVRFFGAWTRVPAGAAHFAVKSGAPVITAAVWRTPANTYVGLVRPPLRFATTGDREHDTAVAMQRIMADVEDVIREHPDQWYMFRRMWPEAQATQARVQTPPFAQPSTRLAAQTHIQPQVQPRAQPPGLLSMVPVVVPAPPPISREAAGS